MRMVSVFFIIGSISPTSIPVELASMINRETDVDVTLIEFYEGGEPNVDQGLDDIDVISLGADSRFDIGAMQDLFHIMRSESVDMVHTHDNFIGSIGRILAWISGIPIVDTEHRKHSTLTCLQNFVNLPTLPLSDIIVTNSKTTLESFSLTERIMLYRTPKTVVHNGVDIDRIQNAEPKKFDKYPVIVCAARFVPIKDHETLIRAFSDTYETIPGALLVLIGDGPQLAEMKTLASHLGIRNAVRFTGNLSRQRVYELFAGADAFVIASRAEGFCVAAAEAMAANLPVVASDIPALREVLGGAAVFAKPGRPESFSEKLKMLLTTPELQNELTEKGVNRASECFQISQTARRYASIYSDIYD